ncbi:NUDIX domain-containing protein [Candidatus Woesebacteria bacterium]|nr:MAG: NUDIX domain-containing protein [Candidatus Woesebacteria bacterium]
MINKNELLCVVDEYDTPQKPLPRHEVFSNDYWRRTAHVWVLNDKNQVLCQQRSFKKDNGAGKWEVIVGGHIGPDDNYFTGAVREVQEETGLPVNVSDLQLVKIYKANEYKEYRAVFYWKTDFQLHEIVREEDEVEAVKFLDLKTVRNYLLYKKHEDWISPGYEKEMFSILNI